MPLIRLSYALYITRRYTMRSTDNTDTCSYSITFFIDLQEFVNYSNIKYCTKIVSFVITFYEFLLFGFSFRGLLRWRRCREFDRGFGFSLRRRQIAPHPTFCRLLYITQKARGAYGCNGKYTAGRFPRNRRSLSRSYRGKAFP